MHQNLLGPDAAQSLPVHPTQIYESLVGALLLGVLITVRRNVKFRGQVFLTFTFAYGALRFLLEILRDDFERGEFGPHISEHLMISGGLLVFALAYILFMAPSVSDPTMRKMTQAIAIVPAVVAFMLLRPPSFGDQQLAQYSTSQWVAILTAIPAAIAYGVFFKAAEAHPASALAIDLSEFHRLHPEAAAAPEQPIAEKADTASNDKETSSKSARPASETPAAPLSSVSSGTSHPPSEGDESASPKSPS